MKKTMPPSKNQQTGMPPTKVRAFHENDSRTRVSIDGKLNHGDSGNMSKVITSPPMAAGVPVLELVRKLEDEKILSRSDRAIVNDILNDPSQRDKLVKIFRDIELASDRAVSIKRLRNTIRTYKDGGRSKEEMISRSIAVSTNQPNISLDTNPQDHGAVVHTSVATSSSLATSSMPPKSPSKSSSPTAYSKPNKSSSVEDDRSVASSSIQSVVSNTKATISKVLTDNPNYREPGRSHVCLKIARRLRDFLAKYDMKKVGTKRFCVIVGSGSFNPLTRMHLRKYFLAKQYIECKTDMVVLGSLLSPAHGSIVRQRYRTCPNEIIPCPHRLAMAQFCVQDTKWASIDPWEITRRRSMDYLSLLEHVNTMLHSYFPEIEIRVLYLCKGSVVPLLSVPSMKLSNFGVVTVCRAPESDNLRISLGSRWNGLIYIAEDTAILDAAMDSFSSKKVREMIKKGQPVENLVGDTIASYLKYHKIGLKMNKVEEWGEDEKKLPHIQSEYAEKNNLSKIVEENSHHDDMSSCARYTSST